MTPGRWICIAALAGALAGFPAAAQAPASSRAAWRADLVALQAELERTYVNLAWMASDRSRVDIPALLARARAAIENARDDEEARQALREFIGGFHDGHLSEQPYLETATGGVEPEPAPFALDQDDAAGGCAALGFASSKPVGFSLPFETLPGFALVADGLADPFRAGTVPLPGGGRGGLIHIQNFRASPFPATCLRAWAGLRASGKAITPDSMQDAAQMAWFDMLAERIGQLRAAGVEVLLVDIGTNSGGDDSGDWAARLFTGKRVQSARLRMVDAPIAAAYFDQEIEDLDAGLATKPDAASRAALERARNFFVRQKAALGSRHCDLSWVWSERRAWNPDACNRLVDGGYSGGPLPSLPPGAFDLQVARRLSWASRVERHFGAWKGPLFLLVNGRSYSSAEMFAAVLQDNRAARLIGERTGGDGCGFMVDGPAIVLPHTRLRLRLPNCIRLRADGTDEVAGVEPDIPLPQREGESARARAARLLRLIEADIRQTPPNP